MPSGRTRSATRGKVVDPRAVLLFAAVPQELADALGTIMVPALDGGDSVNPRCAEISDQPVSAIRPHSASHAVTGLEHHDLAASILQ